MRRIWEIPVNKCTRRVQEREALIGLALMSRMFEIGRPESHLLCEIGYHRGRCISCLNHAPTPRKVVFGAVTHRIRLE